MQLGAAWKKDASCLEVILPHGWILKALQKNRMRYVVYRLTEDNRVFRWPVRCIYEHPHDIKHDPNSKTIISSPWTWQCTVQMCIDQNSMFLSRWRSVRNTNDDICQVNIGLVYSFAHHVKPWQNQSVVFPIDRRQGYTYGYRYLVDARSHTLVSAQLSLRFFCIQSALSRLAESSMCLREHVQMFRQFYSQCPLIGTLQRQGYWLLRFAATLRRDLHWMQHFISISLYSSGS